MNMPAEEFWLCPLGLFMDLWEIHKQFLGIAKPKEIYNIDDVLPAGLD